MNEKLECLKAFSTTQYGLMCVNTWSSHPYMNVGLPQTVDTRLELYRMTLSDFRFPFTGTNKSRTCSSMTIPLYIIWGLCARPFHAKTLPDLTNALLIEWANLLSDTAKHSGRLHFPIVYMSVMARCPPTFDCIVYIRKPHVHFFIILQRSGISMMKYSICSGVKRVIVARLKGFVKRGWPTLQQ